MRLHVVFALALVTGSMQAPARAAIRMGPFPAPPPGAPPLSSPAAPPAPAIGSIAPAPAVGESVQQTWIPGGNLWGIAVSRDGAVAVPAPPAVFAVQDLAGADQVHFSLSWTLVAEGSSAYIRFGASPWGTGYSVTLTPSSPFWTTPRVDNPLGGTVPASYSFTVIVNGPDGSVIAASDPLLVVGPIATSTASYRVPDHFKCYSAVGRFPARTVSLADQFERVRTKVLSHRLLCNPVDKQREGIHDKTAHLTGYTITGPSPKGRARTVVVTDQFGSQRLRVSRPELLLVPSEKNNQPSRLEVDHYTCYGVSGRPVLRSVSLADQFISQRVLVRSPRLLCVPTSKNGEGIRSYLVHLLCYDVTPPVQPPFRARAATVRNQFGAFDIRVLRPELLCNPAAKVLLQLPLTPPPTLPPITAPPISVPNTTVPVRPTSTTNPPAPIPTSTSTSLNPTTTTVPTPAPGTTSTTAVPIVIVEQPSTTVAVTTSTTSSTSVPTTSTTTTSTTTTSTTTTSTTTTSTTTTSTTTTSTTTTAPRQTTTTSTTTTTAPQQTTTTVHQQVN